jgi:hypothetical protein
MSANAASNAVESENRPHPEPTKQVLFTVHELKINSRRQRTNEIKTSHGIKEIYSIV